MRPLRLLPVLLCVTSLVLACAPARAQSDVVELEVAFPNVTFDLPLAIRFPDDGENKVYVAEWEGRVMVMDNTPQAQEATVFLDITDKIATTPSGEFFGVEFHPDYAENGYFFVRYKLTDPDRSVLSRFSRSTADPLVTDPDSELILFEIETPGNTQNHHGGDIAFGNDGYLYVPMGDGGVLFDAVGNAQDRTTILGKVLRLDVDNPSGGLNYGIPADNPFVGNGKGWREEIYALGFRNPWRMSVDRVTGDVWLGNVGESTWEEVEYVEPGKNYGWPVMEGPICAPFNPPGCDQSGLTLPVWAYDHDTGSSITGGYVYRGSAIPALYGKYVYADFASTRLWAIERDSPTASELLLDTGYNITTFGEDLDGELYFTQYFAGRIYKIVPGPGATDTTASGPASNGVALFSFPNPVRDVLNVRFTSEASRVRLAVYDVLGRRVATLFDAPVGPGADRTVALDAEGLVPGVYILRLDARGETITQRLTVVR